MSIVYFNVRGSNGGGGPSVFVHKASKELIRIGHKVIYDNPHKANTAICIIGAGKVLKRCKNSKTNVMLRIDGIYNDEYNKKFNRAIRPDMASLHNELKRDIPLVDNLIYQSNWSKERIDREICVRTGPWSIIHNGVDTSLFKPSMGKTVAPKKYKLIHVGLMRNGYLMESLMGMYSELKSRGNNVSITLVGSMDVECRNVFTKYAKDSDVNHVNAVPNSSLPSLYSSADIYIGPRQGSSSDNVIAEAQACGLPVVIPSWGGNTDMVKDGVTGVVVPTGHWDYTNTYWVGLADAVEKIIGQDICELKRQSRDHAVAELGIDRMAEKYIKSF